MAPPSTTSQTRIVETTTTTTTSTSYDSGPVGEMPAYDRPGNYQQPMSYTEQDMFAAPLAPRQDRGVAFSAEQLHAMRANPELGNIAMQEMDRYAERYPAGSSERMSIAQQRQDLKEYLALRADARKEEKFQQELVQDQERHNLQMDRGYSRLGREEARFYGTPVIYETPHLHTLHNRLCGGRSALVIDAHSSGGNVYFDSGSRGIVFAADFFRGHGHGHGHGGVEGGSVAFDTGPGGISVAGSWFDTDHDHHGSGGFPDLPAKKLAFLNLTDAVADRIRQGGIVRQGQGGGGQVVDRDDSPRRKAGPVEKVVPSALDKDGDGRKDSVRHVRGDRDGDGIKDSKERRIQGVKGDRDGDGIKDSAERRMRGVKGDRDGDGISDAAERRMRAAAEKPSHKEHRPVKRR